MPFLASAPAPLLPPLLCVGIDVGKTSHVAAFVSRNLLARHKRFLLCPVRRFGQNRADIDAMLAAIRTQVPLERVAVLMERTGHYHRALAETLMAEGLTVYVIAIHAKKTNGMDKTDKQDALRLANLLYSQAVLGLQVDDTSQRVERRLPPTPAAAALAPLVRMHYELTQQLTRARNKLTALADEIFPEFSQIFRDVNLVTALDLREHFPTPAAVAAASLADIATIRHSNHPTNKQIQQLQELAATSIGVTEEHRLYGLLLEQSQLIVFLRLVSTQLAAIDGEILQKLEGSREGQILLSMPAIGLHHAAILLASIGNIRNFEKASHLRRFVGWAPQSFQTGTSFDRDTQTRTGSRLIKREMYLICMDAIKREPWKSFYDRLVLKKCPYDARLKRYRGKMKVVGRLAGTIATMIFALLKEDARLVDATPEGADPPSPRLYDPAIHLSHRSGARIHADQSQIA